jgi:tetratricopeptide (TPR) repeat protein
VRRIAAVLAVSLLSQARPSPPTALALLDQYERGEYDAVVRAFLAARDVGALRSQLETKGAAWATAVGVGTPVEGRRRLVAATMALELANARLEDEWRELRPLVEWGCQLLRPNTPGAAERLWQLAAVAVSEGALDTGVLFKLGGPTKSYGHLAHAKARFPNEPRFALAERTAILNPVNGEPDLQMGMEPNADSTPAGDLGPASVAFGGGSAQGALESEEARRRLKARQQLYRDTAVKRLREKFDDPAIGAEAALRAGYVLLVGLQSDPALEVFHIAARQSASPYATYLAHFLRGRVLERMHRPEEAERAYAAAADAMPHAQSAALARSALLMRAGRTADAHELTLASFSAKPRPPDPWRLFPYGDYYRWPELIAQLRKALAR